MRMRAAAAPPPLPRARTYKRGPRRQVLITTARDGGRGRARARSGNADFAGFRIRPMVVESPSSRASG